jgi:hypothetical protein
MWSRPQHFPGVLELATRKRAPARYGGVFWYRERRHREALAGPVERRPNQVARHPTDPAPVESFFSPMKRLHAAARDHQPGRLSDAPQVVRREYKAVELYAAIGPSPPKPSTQAAVHNSRRPPPPTRSRPPSARSSTSRPTNGPRAHAGDADEQSECVQPDVRGRTRSMPSRLNVCGVRLFSRMRASRQLRCRVGPRPTRTWIGS